MSGEESGGTSGQQDLEEHQKKVITEAIRQKRRAKRDFTKLHHQLEKLTVSPPYALQDIENLIDALWDNLDRTQIILEDITTFYIDAKDEKNQEITMQESEAFEEECQQVIKKAQKFVVEICKSNDGNSTHPIEHHGAGPIDSVPADLPQEENPQEPNDPVVSDHTDSSPAAKNKMPAKPLNTPPMNAKLEPLKVPTFDGNKTKFEEFWMLFTSLIDLSNEDISIKMARLRQCLSGSALEAVRGLGVSKPEYEEAKAILKSKFGGQRRQLRAYLDELEKLPQLKPSDVQGLEKFSDLLRVTVVKLQAEGRDGELGDGTLHSILVKKLSDRYLENYTRWISEHGKQQSVINLKQWLTEEVTIKVEAVEMGHGLEAKPTETNVSKVRFEKKKTRSFFNAGKPNEKSKAPCVFCSGINHGIWNCKAFQQISVEDRWHFAKQKKLCFRCLGSDHHGKDCRRSQECNVDGCQRSHHRLLHRYTGFGMSGSGIETNTGSFAQATNSSSWQPPSTSHFAQSSYQPSSTPFQQSSSFQPSPLWKPPGQSSSSTPAPPWEGVQSNHAVSMSTRKPGTSTNTYSLRTIPVWIKAHGKKIKVNAILDDGSNETFLNEEVASALGLHAPFQTVQVQVLNNSVETFQSMPIKIEIESVAGNYNKEIEVHTCPRQVTGNYKVEDWNLKKAPWSHLEQCDFPKPAKDGIIDLLIGVDNAELHYSMADIRGNSGDPIARLGPLGWTCVGPTDNLQTGKRSHLVHSFLVAEPAKQCLAEEQYDTNNLLRRFWEIDSYATQTDCPKVMTKDEREALEIVQTSLKHTGTRYRIAVPWKENKSDLANNQQTAKQRLQSTEKNLANKEYVKKEYQSTIEAYVEKGYLRKLSPDECLSVDSWYLPHFPIVRMDKATTKVRIVFDCSSKHAGLSLNDVIHAGPKLQNELFDVLVRFRRNPIGLVCDIKEMYLQIEIEEKDRPFFRILWRDYETNREPDVYEFSRVVFGKNSAPMESQFVSQENARRHQETFPLAADTVLKSTYMDDSIDSVEDEATAMKLYKELRQLWEIGGMQARKWISNSKEVVAAIPEEYRASEATIGNDHPVTKTLGVSWSSTEDVLTISTPPASPRLQVTKRNLLRKIAAIFDPLGLVSPVVITGKILLQTLWTRGYEWDDEIQDDTATKIITWLDQLAAVSTIQIPRCIRSSMPVHSFKLISFADASTVAYGAAVYVRCEYEHSNDITSHLLASKSRVAPLVPVTVPRLELMAAVLGLRLILTLMNVLQVAASEVKFYSDSLDVLWWIRGHGRDFRPFVANRVGEIQMFSDPSQWHHVSTTENPADLISRGVQPEELANNTLWWHGPEWLRLDEKDWPKIEGDKPQLPEQRTKSVSLLARLKVARQESKWRLDPKRFSSWMRLVRIHARVIRVLSNMKSKRISGEELLPEEILDAEEDIIRQAQYRSFKPEYEALAQKKPLPAKSQIAKLSLRLDDNGIIRLEGRLMYADLLTFDEKFPILLPRGHHVTKLIVKAYHEAANHAAGTNFILSQLSKRFWIPAAREEIKSWEKECNECKKRKTKLASQVMAPLPAIRLRFTLKPFDQTAVDYAGPFQTIQGRGLRRQKRWLCLFTCLQTRAIHLEMAWGLDTDSFLNAFTRFTSRRGVPSEMISDNGTNFVGAVNELKELVGKLDKDRIQQKTNNLFNKVQWYFNPPAGPHFGGIHESMIKSAKKAIYAVLGQSDVRDEELITVFTGVESLLNARPLTYQSSEHQDVTPLTPSHFLHGQQGGQIAPDSVDTTDFTLKKRWRRIQQLITQVWSRWLSEYIPTLHRRPKWTEVVKDLKVGDIVLALEPNTPRGQWPLGRIIDTFPGRDGHTRVAKVQCGGKAYVRPIHKLVPLFTEH